jgi:hypothetical protein
MVESCFGDTLALVRELRQGRSIAREGGFIWVTPTRRYAVIYVGDCAAQSHLCIPPVAKRPISRRIRFRSDQPRKRASSVSG